MERAMHKEMVTGQYEYKAHQDSMKLAKLIDLGVVVEVPAIAFNRGAKRKSMETFVAYKRGLKNMKRAMKAYFKFGPGTKVRINKDTMTVVK